MIHIVANQFFILQLGSFFHNDSNSFHKALSSALLEFLYSFNTLSYSFNLKSLSKTLSRSAIFLSHNTVLAIAGSFT
ncbi:MAG: hypothetical protein WCG25_09005 [bacterium]